MFDEDTDTRRRFPLSGGVLNETVAPEQWLAWDLGFLVWGALMLGVGAYLVRIGRREPERQRGTEDRSSMSPSR